VRDLPPQCHSDLQIPIEAQAAAGEAAGAFVKSSVRSRPALSATVGSSLATAQPKACTPLRLGPRPQLATRAEAAGCPPGGGPIEPRALLARGVIVESPRDPARLARCHPPASASPIGVSRQPFWVIPINKSAFQNQPSAMALGPLLLPPRRAFETGLGVGGAPFGVCSSSCCSALGGRTSSVPRAPFNLKDPSLPAGLPAVRAPGTAVSSWAEPAH
jgi:hypothetical protein